jgi:hypothetical protein
LYRREREPVALIILLCILSNLDWMSLPPLCQAFVDESGGRSVGDETECDAWNVELGIRWLGNKFERTERLDFLVPAFVIEEKLYRVLIRRFVSRAFCAPSRSTGCRFAYVFS